MAISYIANALGGTTTTTSFSITLPTTQADDILILEFCHRGTGDGTIGGTSVTTGGLTWTLAHSQLFASSAFSGKTYWTRCTGDHSGQTVTGSSLTNSCAAIVTQYRGAVRTGDPLADATINGEQNASGNESQGGITTTTPGAWVVLVVVNSPDLAVTNQSSTSPGTLTARAERLSTGGTDTSIAHASAEKATTGGTNNLTWSQTNAASGSWGYAITPARSAGTGAPTLPLITADGDGDVSAGTVTHEGTGSPSLPLLTASGTGKKTRKGTGTPNLPLLTASGTGKKTRKGSGTPTLPLLTADGTGDVTPATVTHEGDGSPSLPLITASGTGKRGLKSTGTPSLPLLTASGAGKKTRKGTGAPSLPLITASGAAKRGLKSTGAPSLPLLTAAGEGKKTRKGTGTPSLPILTASGVGKRALKGTGEPVLPLLTAEGAGILEGVLVGEGAATLPILTADGVGRIVAPSTAVQGGGYGFGAFDRGRLKKKLEEEREELADRLEAVMLAEGSITKPEADLLRLRGLVAEYSELPNRAKRAVAYAERARTEQALILALREMQRLQQEEELAVLLVLSLDS